MPLYGGEQIYGIPSSMMACIHRNLSMYAKNTSSAFSPYHGSGPLGNQFGRPKGMGFSSHAVPTFTINSVAIIRQQLDKINYEMIHVLTKHMGTILRPLNRGSTESYQQLATQMTQRGDSFGAPRVPVRPNIQIQPEVHIQHEEVIEETVNQE